MSRRQSLYIPLVISLGCIHESIVQPIGPALPEFEAVRDDPVSPPEIRQGNLAVTEFLGHARQGILQDRPGPNTLTLG